MKGIILEVGIPVFILVFIGVWLTYKEFKDMLNSEIKKNQDAENKRAGHNR